MSNPIWKLYCDRNKEIMLLTSKKIAIYGEFFHK